MNIVIINGFDTYEGRVMLLREYFAGRGDSVRVITSDYRHVQKCKRSEAPEGFIMVKTRPYRKNLSAGRIISHIRFAQSVRKELECQEQTPDLVWVMIPPNSLAKQLVKWRCAHPDAKLILDVIDVWPEAMPFRGMEKLPPLLYWRNLRNKNLPKADMVVTECGLFQNAVRGAVDAERLHTLYFAKKGTGLYENREARRVVGETGHEQIGLCYLGSMNNIVDIQIIGEIIKQIAAVKPVTLHVVGDGERKEELMETAKQTGAEVKYHGSVYDTDAKAEILAECSFGLNIMKESVCVGLTMKSMDYFEAGLPMINNIKGDTWDIIEQNGFGVNYPFDTERLLTICNDAEIGRRIHGFYEEHFSENAFDGRLEDLMRRLV